MAYSGQFFKSKSKKQKAKMWCRCAMDFSLTPGQAGRRMADKNHASPLPYPQQNSIVNLAFGLLRVESKKGQAYYDLTKDVELEGLVVQPSI